MFGIIGGYLFHPCFSLPCIACVHAVHAESYAASQLCRQVSQPTRNMTLGPWSIEVLYLVVPMMPPIPPRFTSLESFPPLQRKCRFVQIA